MAMSMVMSTLGSHERTCSRENNASSELHSDHRYPGISLVDAVITRPVVLSLNGRTRPVKGLLESILVGTCIIMSWFTKLLWRF